MLAPSLAYKLVAKHKAALVSTVALNGKSLGGRGDAEEAYSRRASA